MTYAAVYALATVIWHGGLSRDSRLFCLCSLLLTTWRCWTEPSAWVYNHLCIALSACATQDIRAQTVPAAPVCLLSAIYLWHAGPDPPTFIFLGCLVAVAWVTQRIHHITIGGGDLVIMPALWCAAGSGERFLSLLWAAACLAVISHIFARCTCGCACGREVPARLPFYPYLSVGLFLMGPQ